MGKKLWLENLAKNVRKRRAELHLSQEALAARSKLSLSTITRIEQRIIENPTMDTLEALEKALKLRDGSDLLRKG